jgi:hypothetical protein
MPRTSWFGLAATVALATFMAVRPRYGLFAWLVLSGIACLSYRPAPSPSNWQGIDTEFRGSGINLPDPLGDYRNAQFIQQTALASPASVIVFPETSVHRWNSSTDLFWDHSSSSCRNGGNAPPRSGRFYSRKDCLQERSHHSGQRGIWTISATGSFAGSHNVTPAPLQRVPFHGCSSILKGDEQKPSSLSPTRTLAFSLNRRDKQMSASHSCNGPFRPRGHRAMQ